MSSYQQESRDARLRIAFVFHKGRLARLDPVRQGEAPSEFFFGARELERKGVDVGYFEVDVEAPTGLIGGCLNWLLMQGLLPEKMTGGAMSQVRRLLMQLRHFDCVVGTTSGIAFALALWKSIGLLKRPIIAIHCGLINNPYGLMRRKLTCSLLRNMHTVIYGEGERKPMLELCPDIEDRLTVNQFGVDTSFWHPGGSGGNYVLAVGNDGRRDYETLIRAAPSIPKEIRIITLRELPKVLPDNVTVTRGSWHRETLSDRELRTLYQEACCLVVPLKESCQPSGQSVTLQAMACGCPVVLTLTSGLWSKEMMRNGYNVLFTRAEDSKDLADKVNKVCDDLELFKRLSKAGRETVESIGTIQAFADKMEICCRKEVEWQGSGDLISNV